MAVTSAQVQELYVAYLGRAADKAGLDYWTAELNATPAVLTLEDLRANFVNEQPEYAAIYGDLTREETVVQIYNNLFGRAPDAAGLTYWTTGDGASVNADQLMVAFISGASATDAKVIANKTLVAEVYTSTAGAQFSKADAASIISGVDNTNTSISTALDKLANGSLSGIAVPQAVSAIVAQQAAAKAVVDFEKAKVSDLQALSKDIAALTTASDKQGLLTDVTASTDKTYAGLQTAVGTDLGSVRTQLGGTTAELKAAAVTTAATLETARLNYLTSDQEAVAEINAYKSALAAVAANPAPNAADAQQAVDVLAAYAANANNKATFEAALTKAGFAPAATAQDLYDTLSDKATTAAQVTKITDAFSAISQFSAVKSYAALDQAAAKADAALSAAAGDLNGAYLSAYEANVTANEKVALSTSLDGLEARDKAIDTAYDSLTSAATAAGTALNNSNAEDVVAAAGDATKADVFYFADGVKDNDDFSIGITKGDVIYLGNGLTLNTTAQFNDDGVFVGGNNGALEAFVLKDGNGAINLVLETKSFGSDGLVIDGTGVLSNTTDNIAVIELSGVTSVDQVSFANGVVSFNIA